jgi:hypothetical protein
MNEREFINGELERMGKEVTKVYIMTPPQKLLGEAGHPRKHTETTARNLHQSFQIHSWSGNHFTVTFGFHVTINS